MQWKQIKVRELQPGMVLMSDIFCPQTGILLLKAGVVLHGLLLGYLQKYNADLFCYVSYSKEKVADAGEQEDEKPFQADFIGSGDRMISMDKEAKEILLQACRTLNRIYSSREIKPYYRELYAVIEDLVGKILDRPEMMVSIALQKMIDDAVYCHAINVCVFSVFLGKLTGLKEIPLRELALSGIMHDIGMMDVPAEIWQKKGPLTGAEFSKVKEHSQYSFFRLAGLDQVDRPTLLGVLQHHERLDGSGYPHGLKNDGLHLWGKILGITDVFDAYTSERVYRKAHTHYQGLEYLRQSSVQFDKDLLHLFIQNLSFFPIGSRVQLNTGEKGIVMGIHKHAPHRPIVRVRKEDGIGEKLLDLTDNGSLYIEKLL